MQQAPALSSFFLASWYSSCRCASKSARFTHVLPVAAEFFWALAWRSANADFSSRTATSPALFNRCVIDWFGEWSSHALYQVGHEFTLKLQLSERQK